MVTLAGMPNSGAGISLKRRFSPFKIREKREEKCGLLPFSLLSPFPLHSHLPALPSIRSAHRPTAAPPMKEL